MVFLGILGFLGCLYINIISTYINHNYYENYDYYYFFGNLSEII